MLSRSLGLLAAGGLLGLVGPAIAEPPRPQAVTPLVISTGEPAGSPLNAAPDDLRLPGDTGPVKKIPPAPSGLPATGPAKPAVTAQQRSQPNIAGKAAPAAQRAGVNLLAAPPVPSHWGEGFGIRPVPAKPAAPATAPVPSAATPAAAAPPAAPAPFTVETHVSQNQSARSPGPLPPLYPSRKWPPAHNVRPPNEGYVTSGQIVFEDTPQPASPPAAPIPAAAPVPPAPPSPAAVPVPDPVTPIPVAAPVPPPAASVSVPAATEGTLTSGRIVFDAVPPAPLPVQPAPAPVAPRMDVRPAAAPVARTPEPAPVSVSRPAPAPPAAVTSPLQVWQLKRRVRAACGTMVQDVQVLPQGDNTLLVKVRVDDALVQRRVTEMILKLPEMTSLQVRLHVDVAH